MLAVFSVSKVFFSAFKTFLQNLISIFSTFLSYRLKRQRIIINLDDSLVYLTYLENKDEIVLHVGVSDRAIRITEAVRAVIDALY